jgi:serine phosphatase RsbU (regulator of sigma subunit)
MHPVPVEDETVHLAPGDTLVLYTDGITEAFTPLKATGDRDMFGTDRLDATLTACSGAPECAIDSVHRALYQHTGAMRRDDDQTLVVLQRLPTASAP